MSRQPQQQYGFIEADENPFDDGPVVSAAPVRQAPAASRPKQPRAQGGAAASPAQGQARQSQPRASTSSASTPSNSQAPRSSVSASSVAAPVAAAAVGAAAPAAAVAGAAAAAPAKKSVFGMFGSKTDAPAAAPLDDAALREANLRAREEKMLAKEMEVEAREREVRSKELASKNWPCRCCRILYHSIPDQIPARLQPMIRKFYYLMFFTWFSLIFNFLTVVIYWGESDSDQGFLWGLVYLFGIPGSWIFWYSNVYKGAAKASGRKYVFFFFGFFFHFAIVILIAVGTPTLGCGGLLVMLKAFSGSYTTSGIFALITTAIFTINFFISCYLFKKARDAWRSGGGSEELEKDRKKMKLAGKAGMAAV